MDSLSSNFRLIANTTDTSSGLLSKLKRTQDGKIKELFSKITSTYKKLDLQNPRQLSAFVSNLEQFYTEVQSEKENKNLSEQSKSLIETSMPEMRKQMNTAKAQIGLNKEPGERTLADRILILAFLGTQLPKNQLKQIQVDLEEALQEPISQLDVPDLRSATLKERFALFLELNIPEIELKGLSEDLCPPNLKRLKTLYADLHQEVQVDAHLHQAKHAGIDDLIRTLTFVDPEKALQYNVPTYLDYKISHAARILDSPATPLAEKRQTLDQLGISPEVLQRIPTERCTNNLRKIKEFYARASNLERGEAIFGKPREARTLDDLLFLTENFSEKELKNYINEIKENLDALLEASLKSAESIRDLPNTSAYVTQKRTILTQLPISSPELARLITIPPAFRSTHVQRLQEINEYVDAWETRLARATALLRKQVKILQAPEINSILTTIDPTTMSKEKAKELRARLQELINKATANQISGFAKGEGLKLNVELMLSLMDRALALVNQGSLDPKILTALGDRLHSTIDRELQAPFERLDESIRLNKSPETQQLLYNSCDALLKALSEKLADPVYNNIPVKALQLMLEYILPYRIRLEGIKINKS